MHRDVRLVQTFYPQIYLACHTRHKRRRSSIHNLSPADSTLLAHLSERTPTSPGDLAQHLNVSKSSVSAALKRLVALGYVLVSRSAGDRRAVEIRLAPAGAAAMAASSVLETGRVERLLRTLNTRERRTAIRGLALLARAARDAQSSDAPHASHA